MPLFLEGKPPIGNGSEPRPAGEPAETNPGPAQKEKVWTTFVRRAFLLAILTTGAISQEHAVTHADYQPTPTTPVTVRVKSPNESPVPAESSPAKLTREPGSSTATSGETKLPMNLLSIGPGGGPTTITTVYSRDVGHGRGAVQESFRPYGTFWIGDDEFTVGLSPGLGIAELRVVDNQGQQLLEQPERLGMILQNGDGVMLTPDHKLLMWRCPNERIEGNWFAWDRENHLFRWTKTDYSDDRFRQVPITQAQTVHAFERTTHYQRSVAEANRILSLIRHHQRPKLKALFGENYSFREFDHYWQHHPQAFDHIPVLDSRDGYSDGASWTFKSGHLAIQIHAPSEFSGLALAKGNRVIEEPIRIYGIYTLNH